LFLTNGFFNDTDLSFTSIPSILLLIWHISQENIIPAIESGEDGNEESYEIPAWIKNNACWWSQGAITDGDFVNGLQFLIKEGIIKV